MALQIQKYTVFKKIKLLAPAAKMTRFKAAARGYIGGEPSIHGPAAMANRYTAIRRSEGRPRRDTQLRYVRRLLP